MKRSHLILFALVAGLAVVLAACSSGSSSTDVGDVNLDDETQVVPAAGGSYTDVSVKGLTSMLETKDFVFVNVHIPYAGEIEQTDDFVPFDQIEQNLSSFPADRDAKIVLYCRSGGMSAISSAEMVRLGYTNVWNLDGGMNAWVASGNELLQNNA